MDKNTKNSVIKQYRIHETDTGSADVQIALLTHRISRLTEHLQNNKKDHSSRRGLIGMVNRRRKLLAYLQRQDRQRYESIIKSLGLRK
ncbi:MAG: 30S ribosomal protein S15 [Methylacidiphilales bacterium]|nr:30S ribosomal protein S15 [Candidatus Methylacidiphilales bacterium]MDW8348752.1 30S ribosomal protein S15 [Verrucomicrobiae bacterium]